MFHFWTLFLCVGSALCGVFNIVRVCEDSVKNEKEHFVCSNSHERPIILLVSCRALSVRADSSMVVGALDTRQKIGTLVLARTLGILNCSDISGKANVAILNGEECFIRSSTTTRKPRLPVPVPVPVPVNQLIRENNGDLQSNSTSSTSTTTTALTYATTTGQPGRIIVVSGNMDLGMITLSVSLTVVVVAAGCLVVCRIRARSRAQQQTTQARDIPLQENLVTSSTPSRIMRRLSGSMESVELFVQKNK